MLIKRIFTALVLLPLTIYLILQNNNSVLIISISLIFVLACLEYSSLIGLKGKPWKAVYILLLLVAFYFLNSQAIDFMPYWQIFFLFFFCALVVI